MDRPCRIVLIGMMGSGKSTVGELLSQRTGWPHHDNDVLLHSLFNATPREILAAGDEASLLAAEVEALTAGLAAEPPSIVSAAGGTIADAGARELLADAGFVVWLRATEATILRRAGGGEHRPWPKPNRLGWIRDALAKRNALYESVANLMLDADETSPAALADQIFGNLREAGMCRALRLDAERPSGEEHQRSNVDSHAADQIHRLRRTVMRAFTSEAGAASEVVAFPGQPRRAHAQRPRAIGPFGRLWWRTTSRAGG